MKDFRYGQPLDQLGDFYVEIAMFDEPFTLSDLREQLINNGWTWVLSKNLRRAIDKLIDAGLVTYDDRSKTFYAVQYLPNDLKFVTMSNLCISPFTGGVIELTKNGKIKEYCEHRSRYFCAMVEQHSRFLASIGVFEEVDGEFFFVSETPLINRRFDDAPILPNNRIYKDRWKKEKPVVKEKPKTKLDTELDRYWAERSTKDIIDLNRMMLGLIPCPLE